MKVAERIYPEIFIKHQRLLEKHEQFLRSDKVVIINPLVEITGLDKLKKNLAISAEKIGFQNVYLKDVFAYSDELHVGGTMTMQKLTVAQTKKDLRRKYAKR